MCESTRLNCSAWYQAALNAQLAPDDSHTLYVYAVGLYSTGQKEEALSILDKARVRFPANGEISSALQAYCAEQAEAAEARAALALFDLSAMED